MNAAHAIRAAKEQAGETDKGRITVSTHREDEHARVCITDTGTGIPEKILNKIFDPFFTTKDVGVGTGQGLAISRSVIVDKHGGTLDVESTPGEGSTFTLRIPLAAEPTAGGSL